MEKSKMKRQQKAVTVPKTVPVETVVRLLGAGAFLAASVAFPALPLALKPLLDMKRLAQSSNREREWSRFNEGRLRQTLRRLHEQKVVKIVDSENGPVVVLTEKGKTKYLKYQLTELVVKRPPKWDGKWRMVIYDIAKYKRKNQEVFRKTLKHLKFLKLQKSVYLTPYPCQREIEFLRQYYGIGDSVLYCIVDQLEQAEVYRNYFGI